MNTLKFNRIDTCLLLVRISLGIVVAAHGAQKLLGWFDGYGFNGTMHFFTNTIGLPYTLGVLIILIESLGMIALMTGLFNRLIAGSLIIIMLGAIFTTHGQFGFFMNWSGNQIGEGFEFHLLAIGLSAVILINGGGAYSLGHILIRKYQSFRTRKPVSIKM